MTAIGRLGVASRVFRGEIGRGGNVRRHAWTFEVVCGFNEFFENIFTRGWDGSTGFGSISRTDAPFGTMKEVSAEDNQAGGDNDQGLHLKIEEGGQPQDLFGELVVRGPPGDGRLLRYRPNLAPSFANSFGQTEWLWSDGPYHDLKPTGGRYLMAFRPQQ